MEQHYILLCFARVIFAGKCAHMGNVAYIVFLSSAYEVSPGPTSQKFFLSVFHSVFNFLVASLDKALVSGSGSDIPLIQDIEPINSRARLSHAKLRFFSLAEHCQFGLLIE